MGELICKKYPQNLKLGNISRFEVSKIVWNHDKKRGSRGGRDCLKIVGFHK